MERRSFLKALGAAFAAKHALEAAAQAKTFPAGTAVTLKLSTPFPPIFPPEYVIQAYSMMSAAYSPPYKISNSHTQTMIGKAAFRSPDASDLPVARTHDSRSIQDAEESANK